MHLTQLSIHSLRNLTQMQLDCSPGVNLIVGENGSGKTSVLEAMHLLSLGKSFRTHLKSRIIQTDQPAFTVRAEGVHDDGHAFSSAIERTAEGETRLRLDGKELNSIVELARLLPLQLFDANSYELISGGPSYRRAFMDWGMFHVKHHFQGLWNRYQRLLKQRNAALKQHWSDADIQLWDRELAALGEEIAQLRADYLQELLSVVNALLSELLPLNAIQFQYDAGWSKESSLAQKLAATIGRDRQLGYTSSGIHRADLKMLASGTPVQDVLSRGQQKLFVFALKLAQGLLLKQKTKRSILYLIDDISSELDAQRQKHLAAIMLKELGAQLFITGTEEDVLRTAWQQAGWPALTMFHVKHGLVEELSI